MTLTLPTKPQSSAFIMMIFIYCCVFSLWNPRILYLISSTWKHCFFLFVFPISQNKPSQTYRKTDCTVWKVKGHSRTRKCHLTIPPVLSDKLILLGLIGIFLSVFLPFSSFSQSLTWKRRPIVTIIPRSWFVLFKKKETSKYNQPINLRLFIIGWEAPRTTTTNILIGSQLVVS